MKSLRWILLLIGTVALFYWRILFTKQFSILWQWEPVTQSYSWYHFAAVGFQKGVLPIWDPYRFSGNTFIGEMQTGLFYPLKFLVYFMPLDSNGMFSERIYNELYVLTHILAALFMFLLARHLRLSHYSSLVAGLSFSLGGYVANTGHPHTLDSAIWLPLIVLFFLQSVEDSSAQRGAFYAALGGIGIGMAILAGGLHMVIMDGIVIGTMSVVISLGGHRPRRVLAMAATVGVVGFLFGAVQVLPSMEYGALSYRWIGGDAPIRSFQKAPYQYLGDLARFSPRSLFSFLFGAAYPGDHLPSNYFGVIPLLLSVIGTWRCWKERLVKYFAVLAVLSFLYSWGSFSFLHNILYLVPVLDMAREAGRFIQVTHFAMAILAGYGVEHLFSMTASNDNPVSGFVRVVRWLVILLTALLIAGSIQTTIAIADGAFLSFFFIFSAYVVLELLCRDFRTGLTKLVLVFLLLWDLYAFNWIIRSKAVVQAENQDQMMELRNARKLVEFLQSKGPLFRVHFDADFPPNIGDVYGIQMTGGMGATMLTDYLPYLGHAKMAKLLNVRYTIRRSEPPGESRPVFADGVWRVFENSDFGDRAWVVHQVEIDRSTERPLKKLSDLSFKPEEAAVLERPTSEPIDPESEHRPSLVETSRYEPTSMEFHVKTHGRGLLVVSEVYYPGWRALVNGRPSQVYRVDGFLRGVVVPDGDSVVSLEYRPLSIRIGAALSLLAVLGTLILGIRFFRV